MSKKDLTSDFTKKIGLPTEQLSFPGGKLNIKLKAPTSELFPYYTGSIIRASFFNFITNQDQELAEILHRDNEIRPYCTTQLRLDGKHQLRTRRKELIVKENDILCIKIGILDDEILERTVRLFIKEKNPKFNLFDKEYEIVSMEYSKVNYEEVKTSDKIKVYFNSPTYFTIKSKPESMLFPDPKYFFMNIVRIWNTFNKNTLVPEEPFFNWLDENIVINDYATYTRRVYISKKITINGFMGWIVYRFKDKQEYFPWINALLEYAKISNVGGNRTGGMGEIDFRWLEEQKARISKEKKDLVK